MPTIPHTSFSIRRRYERTLAIQSIFMLACASGHYIHCLCASRSYGLGPRLWWRTIKHAEHAMFGDHWPGLYRPCFCFSKWPTGRFLAHELTSCHRRGSVEGINGRDNGQCPSKSTDRRGAPAHHLAEVWDVKHSSHRRIWHNCYAPHLRRAEIGRSRYFT